MANTYNQNKLGLGVSKSSLTRAIGLLEHHGGLTNEHSRKIEMVQKKAMAIVIASNYRNYNDALQNLVQMISLSFAEKCVRNPKHRSMFPPNPNHMPNMRRPKP